MGRVWPTEKWTSNERGSTAHKIVTFPQLWYSETSLSGHSVRRPPLYRGHLCKSPMLLFMYIFISVKRPPHYRGQFCMALCDRYKEVSQYNLPCVPTK